MYKGKLEVNMKRTKIVIDEKLIKEGMKTTGIKTRRALVDYALRDLLRRESQKRILELKGKVHWQGDLSSMRKGRRFNGLG
jgi:Arc/MetJ family transcription regulator